MKNTKDLSFVEYDETLAEECHQNFLCEKETAKYTLWKPTATAVEANEKLGRWKAGVDGCGLFLLVKENKSRKIIGFLCAYETEKGVFDHLGIAIGKNFVGKGYGCQTLRALIDFVKEKNGKEIRYSHFKENVASENLAKKCGFKFEKMGKRIRAHDGKEFDEMFYVLSVK